jgi:hypothetical protein
LKYSFTETYRVSQIFNAPIDFVFGWCTDFREDDWKMTGSRVRRHFLERTKKRILWVSEYREGGEKKQGIRAVWLKPPYSWHLDTCGDRRETGDYILTRLGRNRTRLDMVFTVTYDRRQDVEDKVQWEKESKAEWKVFAHYLESDYKSSRYRA